MHYISKYGFQNCCTKADLSFTSAFHKLLKYPCIRYYGKHKQAEGEKNLPVVIISNLPIASTSWVLSILDN